MKLTALCLGFILAGIISLPAQNSAPPQAKAPPIEKIPLPSGPIIKNLPRFAKWRIVYSNKMEDPAKPQAPASPGQGKDSEVLPSVLDSPRQIVVTRTDSIWHSTNIYDDKRTVDQWYVGMDRYVLLPDQPIGLWSDLYSFLPDFQTTEFPDTDWVSAKNYLGVQKSKTGANYVFQLKNPNGTSVQVWVDTVTRYPVRWEQDNAVRVFQVLTPPAQKLSPPQEVQALLKEMELFHRANGHTLPKSN